MSPRMLVTGLAVAGLLVSSCAADAADDPRASASIGQQAVDALESGSDAGCVTDKRQVETALVAHFALLDYEATTMADLAQFGVEDATDRWTLQVPGDAATQTPVVVATAGGPCDG